MTRTTTGGNAKKPKGTGWGCSKKARLPLHENGLLRGEIEYTDQIREVGQSNGERNGQNGDVQPCKGTGSGRMKGLCDERDIRIILSVLYSPSSNSITTNGTWAMSRSSGLPPRSWAEAMGTFMYLQNRTNGDEHSI